MLRGERLEDARWLVRRDGSRFWARWVTEPVYDKTGQLRSVAKVLRDETDRLGAEQAVRASLAEKEALLKEVHHRVKNNLQVITSLINIQAGEVEDERGLALFDETRNRVHSIAAIHELIYRSESFSQIPLIEYVQQLVPRVLGVYDLHERVDLQVQGDDAKLELERAVPFGLLLNELVSNSCKHAFPDGTTGAIRVELHHQEDAYVLNVADTGLVCRPALTRGRTPR